MKTMASALMVLLCLTACHRDRGHAGHDAGPGSEAPSHQASHESHGSELQLTLNHGKKWPVDDHTRASAERLVKLAEEAPAIDSLDAARALGKALDEELDVLVMGCTMTGPAHDQLHVFLTALIPQVEVLKTETELDALARARQEIGSLLAAYEIHFETAEAF